jgi:hypothetical protein
MDEFLGQPVGPPRVEIVAVDHLRPTPGGGDDDRWDVTLHEDTRERTVRFRTHRQGFCDESHVTTAVNRIIAGTRNDEPALEQIEARSDRLIEGFDE